LSDFPDIQSDQQKLVNYQSEIPLDYTTMEIVFFVAKVAIIPFYIILILVLLRKHRDNLKFYFSNFDKKDLSWIRYLVWSIAVIGVLVVIAGVIKLDINSLPPQGTEPYILAATSMWIFGLGFYAVRQTAIFQNVTFQPTYDDMKSVRSQSASDSSIEYRKNILRKFEEADFVTKLRNHLIQEKPYLKDRLTIDELAESLGVPVHEISLFINENMHKNFFDLINSYRVDEFKSRMWDPSKPEFYTTWNCPRVRI